MSVCADMQKGGHLGGWHCRCVQKHQRGSAQTVTFPVGITTTVFITHHGSCKIPTAVPLQTTGYLVNATTNHSRLITSMRSAFGHISLADLQPHAIRIPKIHLGTKSGMTKSQITIISHMVSCRLPGHG